MMSLKGAHILSTDQFDRVALEYIFDVADSMQPYAQRQKITKVLDGAILGNMFFEASTRTRVSFGCAFNLLGGSVRETVGIQASALSKGESLYDMARVLSGYSDAIVLRHPLEGAAHEFAKASRVPIFNGGDGSNEHPTQALLDLYTIKKELQSKQRSIDNLRIAMIGDLKYGRTVHSLSRLLCLFKNVEIVLISPQELQMPGELIDYLHAHCKRVVISDALEENIGDVDIVYSTRIQEERFPSLAEALKYRGRFRLNQNIYTKYCEPNTVIMHPLPRDSRGEASELDNDLNEHPNLAIFRQAENGVLVRMALFAIVFDVAHQVDKYAKEINWRSTKATFD